MYRSCPWSNSVVFVPWGSFLWPSPHQQLVNYLLFLLCLILHATPTNLFWGFCISSFGLYFCGLISTQSTISNLLFQTIAIIRIFFPLIEMPSSEDFISQWTHLHANMEFRAVEMAIGMQLHLIGQITGGPRKFFLKDSIVLEPAEPVQTAWQYGVCNPSTTVTKACWHVGLNVASYWTKAPTDRDHVKCGDLVKRFRIVWKLQQRQVIFSSELVSWKYQKYCFDFSILMNDIQKTLTFSHQTIRLYWCHLLLYMKSSISQVLQCLIGIQPNVIRHRWGL